MATRRRARGGTFAPSLRSPSRTRTTRPCTFSRVSLASRQGSASRTPWLTASGTRFRACRGAPPVHERGAGLGLHAIRRAAQTLLGVGGPDQAHHRERRDDHHGVCAGPEGRDGRPLAQLPQVRRPRFDRDLAVLPKLIKLAWVTVPAATTRRRRRASSA